jgi:hypothetical protein
MPSDFAAPVVSLYAPVCQQQQQTVQLFCPCRASMRSVLLGVVLTLGAQLLLTLLLRTLWARRALASLDSWLQRTFGVSLHLRSSSSGGNGADRSSSFGSSNSDLFELGGDLWGQKGRALGGNGRPLSRADSDASSSSSTSSGGLGVFGRANTTGSAHVKRRTALRVCIGTSSLGRKPRWCRQVACSTVPIRLPCSEGSSGQLVCWCPPCSSHHLVLPCVLFAAACRSGCHDCGCSEGTWRERRVGQHVLPQDLARVPAGVGAMDHGPAAACV